MIIRSYLVNAWDNKEQSWSHCAMLPDSSKSKNDGSLVFLDDFDAKHHWQREREDNQQKWDEPQQRSGNPGSTVFVWLIRFSLHGCLLVRWRLVIAIHNSNFPGFNVKATSLDIMREKRHHAWWFTTEKTLKCHVYGALFMTTSNILYTSQNLFVQINRLAEHNNNKAKTWQGKKVVNNLCPTIPARRAAI